MSPRRVVVRPVRRTETAFNEWCSITAISIHKTSYRVTQPLHTYITKQMLAQSTPSLSTLPIELVYRILDHLETKTIFYLVHSVCARWNLIIDTYQPYQVRLTRCTFHACCRVSDAMRKWFSFSSDVGRCFHKYSSNRTDRDDGVSDCQISENLRTTRVYLSIDHRTSSMAWLIHFVYQWERCPWKFEGLPWIRPVALACSHLIKHRPAE